MRLLLGMALCCLFASPAVSQRGGGGFRGGFVPGGRGGSVRGGVGGLRRGHFGRFGRSWNQPFGIGYFSDGFLDYGGDYGNDLAIPVPDQASPFPSVIVVPALNPPEPPPPPAHPVIQEYHWPASNQDSSTPFFSIVTNDRATHYATMVWIDGGLLRFTTRNGTVDQVPRSAISRDSTYQANAGKNLKPWLP